MHSAQKRSNELQSCIDRCSECHEICTETVQHCLDRGGEHASADHIRLLLDCAQICQVSMDFMVRSSDLHAVTCGACAEICERCAEACAAMDNDEMMRRCADACRACAESCRQMAATGHSKTHSRSGDARVAGH